MFEEIPPRQDLRAKVRRWSDVGVALLTGFFASSWNQLLPKRPLLGLILGAAWLLVTLALALGLSGFSGAFFRRVRTRNYHLAWAVTSAFVAVAASLAFSKQIFPFESALILYCALAGLVSHGLLFVRLFKVEKIEPNNALTH
jgi:CHASE2 domain-containing sensor protein